MNRKTAAAGRVPCPDCQGSGTEARRLHRTGQAVQQDTGPCTTCHGTGTIGTRRAANLTTRRAATAEYRAAYRAWAAVTGLGPASYDTWIGRGRPDPAEFAADLHDRHYDPYRVA